MTIAYFTYNLDFYSGAALQALELSKNIRQDVIFFNFRKSCYRKHYIDNKLVIDVPKSQIYGLFVIVFHVLRHNVKILHLHGLFPLGLIAGWLLNRKMILKTTLMGQDDFESISKGRYAWIKMFLIKKINLNVVLSESLKKINLKYIDDVKIVRLYNSVCLPSKKINMAKTNTFCFVGLICRRKRPYESIEYFINNYSSVANSRLLIVGPYENVVNNIEFDEAYVKQCFDLVKRHNMSERIIFMGNISKQDTFRVFEQSKALLFFSLREGLPNVVLEAMAHDCVPILSPLNGVSAEIVGADYGGFVLKDFTRRITIEEIEDKIRKQIASSIINEKFNIKDLARAYEGIYQELSRSD